MKNRLLSFVLLLVFAFTGIFGTYNAFAEDTYTQRVSVKPHQPTPKTLIHDDDFNDVIVVEAGVDDEKHSIDGFNQKYRTVSSVYNASWIGTSNGYEVAYNDNAVLVNQWQAIQLKNVSDSDKLVVSFDMYNEIGGNLSFALLNKDASANGASIDKPWTFLFNMWGKDKGGALYFDYMGSADTETTKKSSAFATLTAAAVSGFSGRWVNTTMIFERKLNSDGTGYEVSLTDFYLDGTAYNVPSNASSFTNWWIKDSEYANFKLNVRGQGTVYDNLIVYEPYEFSILSASYDETENTVKAIFTDGIDEGSLEKITLISGGVELECEKEFDFSDTSMRTVLLKSVSTLDTQNNSYTVSASNVMNYTKTEVLSESLVFGKKILTAETDGFYTDGKPMSKYVLPKQSITGKATVNNLTEENREFMMFSTYYENGALKAIGNIDKKSIASGETKTAESSLTLSDTVENGTLKTFVLEGNLRPVMKAYEKEVLYADDVKLYLVGDSICDDDYSIEKYRRGLGGFIGDYFSDEVTVVNHGHSGYTIENFMNGSGWKTHNSLCCSWENIKSELKKGDAVMLSLGINDSSKISKGEYTWDYYQESVKTIIDGAREKGAEIILVTSTPNIYAYNSSTKRFSNTSIETARQKLMEVAMENNAACFDLNTALKEKYNELLDKGWTFENIVPAYTLDESNSKVFTKDADGNYISGIIYSDTTHYTREGSIITAKLIADYIKSSGNDLLSFISETEEPVSPAGNLLSDYSFENENAALKACSGGSWKYDSDISRSGNKSVMFTKSGIWSALQIGSSDTYLLDLIKENGAGRYHFEAYIRPGTYFLTNNYTADISIKFINSEGTTVSPTKFEINPIAAPVRVSDTEIETKWQKVSIDFNIDDLQEFVDNDIAKIQLYVSAGIGKGTFDETQSFWVDDACLSKYDRGTKLLLVGDSVCTSNAASAVGQIGWGAYVRNRLDVSKAYVTNTAVGGHTVLSYINGDTYGQSWKGLLSDLNGGDYVFISLGINDEIKISGSNSGGYMWDLYKQHLTTMITEAKEKGVNVLLITPTARGEYAYNSETSLFDIPVRAAVTYMKEVADSTDTLCFDLNQALRDEMNSMLKDGKTKDEVIKYFHVVSTSADGNETVDSTHLNTQGAKYVSNLIMDYVSNSALDLKNLMTE